ncbi:uncharacterized protein LOC133895188 [Phragmites australis]|uniref:uncharacterized protein LOC133895188 n=1 Tax=Phragmites australis TaxID=29695 RepID=UPI002D77F49A|nr:uncharacterized protein LOC133895188 [Phragmites australis]
MLDWWWAGGSDPRWTYVGPGVRVGEPFPRNFIRTRERRGAGKLPREGRAMAQWGSAASLDRWIGQWRCRSPPSPRRASVPPVPPRQARRLWRIGCASVPRELGATAEAELADGASSLALGTHAIMQADSSPRVFVTRPKEEGVVCEGCSGAGWLLCDFCKGKKKNVKSEGSRVYRRCPTCKAAGYILCPRCRVYKCITFPGSNES